MGADALHLLASGAWLGGLISLLILVAQAVRISTPKSEAAATSAAMQFSGVGYIAVATLIGSGSGLNGDTDGRPTLRGCARTLTRDAEQQKYSEIAASVSVTVGREQ